MLTFLGREAAVDVRAQAIDEPGSSTGLRAIFVQVRPSRLR